MILLFIREIASENFSSKLNRRVPIQYKEYDTVNLDFGSIKNLELKNIIGKGKFSTVYKAFWNGKVVSAKCLKPISPIRLKKEIFLLQKVQNLPHVLHLIGLYGDIYSPIILTDIYPSETILNISKSEFLWLFSTLFETISAFHNKSVFHRDLKWSNVLISVPERSLSIIDWGIGELYIPNNKYGKGVGTKGYKAPEILYYSTNYSYLIDIWSAGVMMAEMLFGIPHFFLNTVEDLIFDQHIRFFGNGRMTPVARKFGYFEALPFYKRQSFLEYALPHTRHLIDQKNLNIIQKVLEPDPDKRLPSNIIVDLLNA